MFSQRANQLASNELFTLISRTSNFTEVNNYGTRYQSLLDEYFNRMDLQIMSTIDIHKLATFKSWAPEALATKNKVYPMLTSKMLNGDIFALSVYDNLKKIEGDRSLIFYYDRIHRDPKVDRDYRECGGAEDGRAILTARGWLASEEAVGIIGKLEGGMEELCLINGMLGIDNEFADC